ncbi:TetR/AcrR family transcriptional regulator [Lysinibacillus sphaericus]|uniref:TetR/AcrR family transcriptional regulator n=1 Tax=Lysinibacillus sphaericus TaxID=1421 RepID=A0A544UJQ1_LYSSH|nr:TetR/AcrR family transcriptional regulator [Lysinibacillus sp. SDF0037]TQR33495.1 TetR/AcrR family transcriptional regulator [Lysinibacillus sp. SDF0037]
MSIRHEQKKQRRALILQSALDLFIRKGYGETKVADIAKASNMSMGLLFHYFDSKEKLYEELIRIGCERLQMDFSFTNESPLAIFTAAAEELFDMIRTNPSAAKMFVLMENAQHLDSLSEDLKVMLMEADKVIRKSVPLIEKGQMLGEIKQGNAEALAVAFWCSIQGIAQYIALHPETPCPDTMWVISILENREAD